jgi:hypothetical protein
LIIVADRQIDRIAGLAQAAAFGPPKLDTAGDLAVVDVKTGNDSAG